MIRPSCSVIEQKLQPPKQPRRIVTENLIISYAGSLVVLVARVRQPR